MTKRYTSGTDALIGEHFDDPRPSVKEDPEIAAIAYAFDKPYVFTEKCLKAHGVKLPLPRFRTPEDGLGPFYSDMTSLYNPGVKYIDASGEVKYGPPSRTKQEFTAECDINNIMKRFIDSDFDVSSLPMTRRQAKYGDFTGLPESYHAAVNYVKGAQDAFMTLPADIRARFDNDPQKFLNFLDNPKADKRNYAELVEMGIIDPDPDDGDLSPGTGAAPTGSKAPGTGGKSSRVVSSSVTRSDADGEGDEGD